MVETENVLSPIRNLNQLDCEHLPQQFSIYPRSLLNRHQIFGSQSWIDPTKLVEAIKENTYDRNPSADLLIINNRVIKLFVTDGHHRIGLASIRRIPIVIDIVNIYYDHSEVPYETYGFNIIVNKIKAQVESL